VDESLTGMIPSSGLPFEQLVEELERALIVRASYATKWNQSRTADMLNLKRDKLRYRMKLYDLHPDDQGHTSQPRPQH
jgi:DNA-binding NtrC family response regulator